MTDPRPSEVQALAEAIDAIRAEVSPPWWVDFPAVREKIATALHARGVRVAPSPTDAGKRESIPHAPSPDAPGPDVVLRPWLRHHVWCNCKTDDPPTTERCKCGLRAALAASVDAPRDGLLWEVEVALHYAEAHRSVSPGDLITGCTDGLCPRLVAAQMGPAALSESHPKEPTDG